mgnify:CR=1 FL=1
MRGLGGQAAGGGLRTADGRHPYFTAQTATVQLLLNHMCPAAARPGVCLKR